MEQEQDHIEIPSNVLVHCPKVQFALVRMGKCTECEYFAGLADRYPGSQIKFAQRYMLRCKHDPVMREPKELAE